MINWEPPGFCRTIGKPQKQFADSPLSLPRCIERLRMTTVNFRCHRLKAHSMQHNTKNISESAHVINKKYDGQSHLHKELLKFRISFHQSVASLLSLLLSASTINTALRKMMGRYLSIAVCLLAWLEKWKYSHFSSCKGLLPLYLFFLLCKDKVPTCWVTLCYVFLLPILSVAWVLCIYFLNGELLRPEDFI